MKKHLSEAVRAFVAAVTSPTVVPMEKKVGVFVLTRVLVALGASAGVIEIVSKLG